MLKIIKNYTWDIFVNKISASYFVPYKIRECMYKLVGIRIGKIA